MNLPSHADIELVAAETTIAAENEPPLPSLDRGAAGGAVWTVVGFVLMQVLRFGFNVVLQRLLMPSVFGVTNLVNLFIQGLHMFSDLGIRQCVVNSPRGEEPAFLNTAWTAQILRGVVLWLLAVAIAWPVSHWYGTPQLLWLTPLVGLTALIEGLTSTGVLTYTRRLDRGPLVRREITAYVVSMSFVVTWLYLMKKQAEPGPVNEDTQMLAFATGNVLSVITEVLLGYTLLRVAWPRFAWDKPASRELIAYGGWIFVSTGFTFLAQNVDRLAIGFAGMDTLAYYNNAAMLARLPSQLIAAVGHQVLFPLYGRLHRAGRSLVDVFPLLQSAINGIGGYLTAGAIAVCPAIIRFAFDDKYLPAGHLVQWLAIAAWFTSLQTGSEVILLALGRARQIAIGQLVKLITLGPLLVGGYLYGGILGFIVGYIVAEAARYAVLSLSVARLGFPVLRVDIMLSMLVALTALATLQVERLLPAGCHEIWPVIVNTLVLTAMWGAILAAWWPGHGRAFVALVRERR